MYDDTAAAFFFGVLSGAIIVALLMVSNITAPRTMVERGWMDHEGKVYRVIPAEVK